MVVVAFSCQAGVQGRVRRDGREAREGLRANHSSQWGKQDGEGNHEAGFVISPLSLPTPHSTPGNPYYLNGGYFVLPVLRGCCEIQMKLRSKKLLGAKCTESKLRLLRDCKRVSYFQFSGESSKKYILF